MFHDPGMLCLRPRSSRKLLTTPYIDLERTTNSTGASISARLLHYLLDV